MEDYIIVNTGVSIRVYIRHDENLYRLGKLYAYHGENDYEEIEWYFIHAAKKLSKKDIELRFKSYQITYNIADIFDLLIQ